MEDPTDRHRQSAKLPSAVHERHEVRSRLISLRSVHRIRKLISRDLNIPLEFLSSVHRIS